MHIAVNALITRHDGKPFQTVVDTDVIDGRPQPIMADLTLGLLLIEALPIVPAGVAVTAVEMMRRDDLARAVFAALHADGMVMLTSTQVVLLKRQIELLQEHRHYSVFACAAALRLVAPDDFADPERGAA